MSTITFQYADVPSIKLKAKTQIKSVVKQIFKQEKKALDSVSYIFCSDKYLLQINQEFLNHDDYTDIITFDLSEGNQTRGEIYISVERVKENALLHNVVTDEEYKRVIFHGALHLCGYRDKKKSEITLMREKENYYLCLFDKQF